MTTKQKIEAAFLELYRTTPIEKITIRRIMEMAGLNRGTFYAHFLDIYDLCEKIEEELKEEVLEVLEKTSFPLNSSDIEGFILGMIGIYRRRGKALPIFLTRPNSNLWIQIKKAVKERIISKVSNIDENERLLLEYAIEYQSSAMTGVLSLWMDRGEKATLDELFFHVRELSTKGVFPTISSLTEVKHEANTP